MNVGWTEVTQIWMIMAAGTICLLLLIAGDRVALSDGASVEIYVSHPAIPLPDLEGGMYPQVSFTAIDGQPSQYELLEKPE